MNEETKELVKDLVEQLCAMLDAASDKKLAKKMAIYFKEVYMELIAAGFTPDQAIELMKVGINIGKK